jgi:hypothetical protein
MAVAKNISMTVVYKIQIGINRDSLENLSPLAASGFCREIFRMLIRYRGCCVYMPKDTCADGLFLRSMFTVVAIHLAGENADSDVIAGASAELGLHSGWKHDHLPPLPLVS